MCGRRLGVKKIEGGKKLCTERRWDDEKKLTKEVLCGEALSFGRCLVHHSFPTFSSLCFSPTSLFLSISLHFFLSSVLFPIFWFLCQKNDPSHMLSKSLMHTSITKEKVLIRERKSRNRRGEEKDEEIEWAGKERNESGFYVNALLMKNLTNGSKENISHIRSLGARVRRTRTWTRKWPQVTISFHPMLITTLYLFYLLLSKTQKRMFWFWNLKK